MISPKYAGEFLLPRTLGLVKSCAQGFRDNLVFCLYLAVSLGMFDRSREVLDT